MQAAKSNRPVSRRRRRSGSPVASFIIHAILFLLALVMVFPFYNMLILSFAKYADVAGGGLYLFPKSIDLTNYKVIFSDGKLAAAFRISAFNVVFGTALAMVVTTLAGYALSKKKMPGRNAILTMFVFTMYFGGGLIPWYLLLKDLGFLDNLLVMTVPGCFSVYNMILMKNYFNTIPESLEESARIDGANDLLIMARIILPVALPIVATISLFYAVGFWNEWYTAMIFLQDARLIPLQLLLRRIVIEATMDLGNEMANQFRNSNIQIYKVGLQMATVAVATLPILLVYPFVQKYFAKGIMLGAVKA